MGGIDEFWERLLDAGILGPDSVGRARARHAQFGGGLDTAVLEFAVLDHEERAFVLERAANTIGLPVARSEYIDAPDLEALARIKRDILKRYPVIPSRELGGRPVLVVPSLMAHELNQIRATVGGGYRLYVGSEIDLWEALTRFADIPLPKRIETIWMGESPSLTEIVDEDACGPTAVPRSTHLYAAKGHGFSGIGDDSAEFASHFGNGQSPITRPGRPQALGLADTADFEERRNRVLLGNQGSDSPHLCTSDDLTLMVKSPVDGHESVTGELTPPLRAPSGDTIPPATG
ncbi:MAG: hypothetical protein VYA30_16135 [Myxococcota bacterium]|nr:hypothetical protein [Myxococcota bacterium]